MFSNRLASAALAVACIGAAAGGGYLALRQTSTSAVAPTVAETERATTAVLPATPVQETETILDDGARKAIHTPAPRVSQKREAPPARATSHARVRPQRGHGGTG